MSSPPPPLPPQTHWFPVVVVQFMTYAEFETPSLEIRHCYPNSQIFSPVSGDANARANGSLTYTHATRSDSSRNGAVIDGSAVCLSARCTPRCRSRIRYSTNVWARVAYFVSIRLCSCLAIPPAPADSFADLVTENYAFTSYNEPPGKIEHVEAVSLPSTGFYCHVTRWYQPYCIDCIASTCR